MACKHLDEFVLDAAGIDAYRAVHANLISPWTPAGLERKSRASICMYKAGTSSKASICYGRSSSRLHACLHCIHVACISSSQSHQQRSHNNHLSTSGLNHRDIHSRENNHPLSVELNHGNIYCSDASCNDYLYHPVLEDISEKLFRRSSRRLSINGSVRFTPWRPRKEETALLRKHRKRKGYTSSNCNKTLSTIGLRGLINLGNTCFMSCIVQTLVHTPLLRDYFLSDRHLCLFDSGNTSGNGGDSVEKQCIVCEMARLFQEFYSGAKNPLVPHALLHMTWQHARHLAGYEQQDAHEFFIATLDLLHKDLIHRTESDPTACDCIVDTIFTGKLQSDVVCQACRSVSTTIDPFWDISLDLPANNILPNGKGGNGNVSHSGSSSSSSVSTVIGANGSKNNISTVSSGPPISLHDCLQRFTKPEHLGSTAKIKCSTCNAYQESTKQLTMKKLPIVASFHLKRFEHSTKLHKKISTRVAFPEHLDMTPFVSHQRNNKRTTSPKSPSYTSSSENSSEMLGSNMYTLFAVINHIGNIEAGHYTSFVRQYKDQWYRCNDHQIVPATIKEVLQSEGYLLFYHKQILEYQ